MNDSTKFSFSLLDSLGIIPLNGIVFKNEQQPGALSGQDEGQIGFFWSWVENLSIKFMGGLLGLSSQS